MVVKDGVDNLKNNLFCQLSSYWQNYNKNEIDRYLETALVRMEKILSKISTKNRYIWNGEKETVFTPYNSIQYSIFLYLLSNAIYKEVKNGKEADMIYYLNKIMNGCDWYYAIDLPDIFFAEHPIGSVMGRAKYGERFFFYQGTTVGGQRDREGVLHYPVIGKNVLMYANSSIIGKAEVGNNVIISTDTTIKNDKIPDNCIVYGQSPFLTIKEKNADEIFRMQSHIWGGATSSLY